MAGKKPRGKTICPSCNAELRIPLSRRQLQVTCPRCRAVFVHKPDTHFFSTFLKTALTLVLIATVAAAVWQFRNPILDFVNGKRESADISSPSNWVTISYGGLIDRSIYTHNQKTIGEVLPDIPEYADDFKGLVQPYFEPYSVLCHDVLQVVNGPDTLPLINIVSQYPAGSEQPAWVALFREGQYQLYYNQHLIRVFVHGTDPRPAAQEHQSVIRHAINDVINSPGMSIQQIEVYTFVNNYATTELRVNTIPATYAVDEFDLTPRRRSLNLAAIENLLKAGVTLEAVEVDADNDLILYGKQSPNQTLAGNPVTLADLAAVYRSAFYCGYNTPYVSLDRYRDHRYSKVNFGGHLENTHVGKVVLEADKMFKAIATGIDPNTNETLVRRITQSVPDFLTQDERALIYSRDTDYTEIGYWFYPDSIETLTDGSLARVLRDQFLSEVDHKVIKGPVPQAMWRTTDHINQNYEKYKNVLGAFRDLSSAGRIMALFYWMKGMDVTSKVELDDLLSVKLPAFKTPTRTRKLLAVTAAAYPQEPGVSEQNVRTYSHVYCVSELLEKCDPKESDKKLLERARQYAKNLGTDQLDSPENRSLQAKLDYHQRNIDEYNRRLDSLDQLIKASEKTLDRKDVFAIDEHNKLVEEYDRAVSKHSMEVTRYNALVDGSTGSVTKRYSIASLLGAIDLDPAQFLRIYTRSGSSELTEIYAIKARMKPAGSVAKSGEWIRSLAGKGGARLNKLPSYNWIRQTSADTTGTYEYSSGKGHRLSLNRFDRGQSWKYEIRTNGIKESATYSKDKNSLKVSHPDVGVAGTATETEQGRVFEFKR